MATNLEDSYGYWLKDDDGYIRFASGASVPSDATAGYATGCIFQHTDGGNGDALYVNEGTSTSCDFNVVEAGSLPANIEFTKESAHSITIAASTTANTAGGALSIAAAAGAATNAAGGASSVTGGAGAGSGAGGLSKIVGGLAGATGTGGAAQVIGGAGGATSGNGGTASVTGGAGTAGNGNGGAVVLAGGAPHGSGKTPAVITRGIVLAQKQGAPTAKTVTAAITAAELLTGIITTTGATAPSVHQLPTGTLLLAELPDFAAGDSFDFTIINTGTGASDDATITVNTDVTIVGNPTVGALTDGTIVSGSGTFRARYTGGVTWIVYRIA